MTKRIIYIILTLILVFQLGCSSQAYKRIVLNEDVGFEEEIKIEHSVSGQIYLEISGKDYFYPSYYHGGSIYGYLLKVNGEDSNDRKYLYRVDSNNKLTETTKERMDFSSGANPINFIGDKVYTINYMRKGKITPMPQLSGILNSLGKNEEEYKYELSYVSGSDNYIVIHELNIKNEIINTYLYDKDMGQFYTNKDGRLHGEVCYVSDFGVLFWIDQIDFQLYWITLKNGQFTLKKHSDPVAEKDVDRVRAVMKNSYELILFHDLKLREEDNWSLFETINVISYNFRTGKYALLFRKPMLEKPYEERLYMEYLGENLLISESFDLFGDYIEITGRKIYRHNYTELSTIYREEFQEKSQEFYPDIKAVTNTLGNEVFSTRGIRKIINGIPITKDIIYQKIKLPILNKNQY